MVNLIRGVTKSGPHKSRKTYDRKEWQELHEDIEAGTGVEEEE